MQMFEKTKPIYMTLSISYELSEEHVQFILQYIKRHYVNMTDYLQIFKFYIEDDEQWLIQKQEEPIQETRILIKLLESEPIDRKVWVMDQVDHVIILFPEDY